MVTKRTVRKVVEPDMTPMIDCTFQLITFFMIVTNFEQTKADERVKLPADMLAKPPAVARRNELVVNVGYKRNSTGAAIDPDPFVFWNGDESTRVFDMQRNFQREARLTAAKEGKDKVKDTVITLRADEEVPVGLVQEIIRQAQEAGYTSFSFKARNEETGE